MDAPVEKVLHGLSKNLQDKILSNIEQKQVNVLFNLEEESDGTVRILDLLEILLSGEGKTSLVFYNYTARRPAC